MNTPVVIRKKRIRRFIFMAVVMLQLPDFDAARRLLAAARIPAI